MRKARISSDYVQNTEISSETDKLKVTIAKVNITRFNIGISGLIFCYRYCRDFSSRETYSFFLIVDD